MYKHVKNFETFLIENLNNTNIETVCLADIMDYPDDEDEQLCQMLTYYEFKHDRFPIVEINPVEWYNNNTVDGAETTIKEAFDLYAEPWQKRLVNKYRKLIKKGDVLEPVIIQDNMLIDGFHRIVAMALENISSAKAVDIY